MPKVAESHLQARRDQILEGARRAFARFGYAGATVARLETEIGLSRGAIFHYFPSKWELFWALAEADQARALEAFIDGGVDEMLAMFIDGDPDWLGVYFEATSILRREPEQFRKWQERTPALQARAQQRFEELRRTGAVRSDVALEEISRFVGIVADGVVIRRAFGLEVDRTALTLLVQDAIAPARA